MTQQLPPWPSEPPVSGAIRLRAFAETDAHLALELGADPYIPKIGSLPAFPTDEQAGEWVQRQCGRHAEGTGFAFAIADVHTDVALGTIGLWLRELPEGRATVGYSVAPNARGRGVATDALRAVTGFAWTIPLVHRLELFIEPWNIASIRVAEAAGFLREGLLRRRQEIAGERRDMLLYAAIRPPRTETPARATHSGSS